MKIEMSSAEIDLNHAFSLNVMKVMKTKKNRSLRKQIMNIDTEEIVASKYWHVDNGGFTVEVDRYGNIEISFGFFGHSYTTILMTANKGFGPKELGLFLIEASTKLERED